jgi:hypothetical protein
MQPVDYHYSVSLQDTTYIILKYCDYDSEHLMLKFEIERSMLSRSLWEMISDEDAIYIKVLEDFSYGHHNYTLDRKRVLLCYK